MVSGNAALSGSYDYGEVARSVLIAVAASYVALDLAGRVTTAKGGIRRVWLGGGAFAMGVGIWAMHFKGMLAFHLPVPVEYHWPTVLASLVLSILSSALALHIVGRQKMGWVEASIGSLFIGAGIVGLHYLCMAAMRMPAITQYSPLLVTLSIFLAIAFSLIALLMAFDLREETRWTVPRRLGSAIVMGAAVSGMHYTGMAAASFWPGPPPDLSLALSVSAVGNNAIGIVALTLILAVMVTSSVERRTSMEVELVNRDLGRRVFERSLQLEAANQELRKEIAERKRAEDAVRRSEEHLQLVIDTAPAMLHSARPDGYVDFFNKRWVEYVGVPLEDIRGWGWTNVLHPEDVKGVVSTWRSSVATGESFEAEARLRRADGEYRLMLLRKVPLRDESGSIVKWYGSATDIEERKRAEQELRQAEAHIRAVLEYSPNWIFLKDTEGRYLLVNREIERVFSIRQEQIKGKTDSELFPAEQASEYRANDLKVLRAGVTMEFEEMVLLPDGPHTSIVHKFPLFDAHGNVYATGGVATDITERKRAEEARRYSEEQYRTVVETATDAVISMDESGTILLANPATTRIFGYEPTELTGKPLTLLMPEFMRKLHDAGFRRYLATGQRQLNWQGTELTALRKNGQEFPVEVSFGETINNRPRVFTGFIRDISEKKRAEDELKTERARLIEAQAVAKVGSWQTELPSLDITWSEQTHRIFETDPSYFHPTRPGFVEFVHPEDRAKVDAAFEASLEKGAPSTVEYRIVMADGRVKVLEEHWKVFHDEQGRPARLVGTCQDVTERKEAGKTQMRLAAIVESSDDAIISKDLNGVVTSWNAGAQRIFGYTQAEAVGHPITIIIPPQLQEEEGQILQRLRGGECIQHFETIRVTKDGKRVAVSLTISPMKDSKGRIVGASKIARNITEQRRAEDELRKQKELFQTVFENIPVMIALLDQNGRYELVNPEWERTIGWTQKEIREQNPDIIAESFPDPQYRQVIKDEAAASVGGWANHRVQVRDGRAIDVAATFVRISDGSSLFIGKDITEWTRTQAALQEAQDKLALVTRLQTMGELAATIAHEVNQPLTAIVTNGNFTLRQIAGTTPNLNQLREAVAEIVDDATRASAVISRIRSLLNRSTPDRAKLDVNRLIREVASLVRNEAARNRVSVRLDLATDLPSILGDGVQLQQVVINLVMNAIDAMRTVTDPRELVIKSRRNADGVLIEVQDSGTGIEPEQAHRIFEPFFTTKDTGIGLGLPISRSIVESHGGRLRIVPTAKGALFEFTLPIDRESAA